MEEHSEVCLIVSSSAHGTLQNCDACSAHSNKCMGMSHRLFGYCSLYMLFSDPTIVVVQQKLRQCNELRLQTFDVSALLRLISVADETSGFCYPGLTEFNNYWGTGIGEATWR